MIGDCIVSLCSEEHKKVECATVDFLGLCERGKEDNAEAGFWEYASVDAVVCGSVAVGQGKTITAHTGQLESLIRLSEAHTRMRFSGSAQCEHVKEAVRIVKESFDVRH